MTLASEAPARVDTIRYHAPVEPLPGGITVTSHEEPDDADDGLIHNDDGSITVGDADKPKRKSKKNFNANLAEDMDEMDLNIIASDLLEAIENDRTSRADWEGMVNKGLDLLGLKIETATSDITSGGNISKVKDPLLLEAVLRYQSNFNAEMLPADGPVKVRDDHVETPPPMMGHNGGPPMGGDPAGPMGGTTPEAQSVSRIELAEAFEKDFNHYLTSIDKNYYPDTDKMSFGIGLTGCAFKKVYYDAVEQRPISRFVMANNLIVNNGASSLFDAKRITHEIPNMSKIAFEQMVTAGVYRDVDLSQPVSDPSPIDAKIAEVQGTVARSNRPEDLDYTVYECYCWLDFEDKDKAARPYKVSVEKDSRIILEIRRNWIETEKVFYKPRRRFVKYSLFPGLGFYDYGYVHLLGNTTRVLSAIESLLVDAGMFSNFPGGLMAKSASRQETNQIRPGPGGFKTIDTGGQDIRQVVMPMPYKPPDPTLMALAQALQQDGRKLGSIAELPLGEGRADVPVGTVLALIEQGTKLLSAAHKRAFASQQEEFELLKELFAENPEALTALSKNPARKWELAEEFEDLNLIPAADPNVSSHAQRVLTAQAVVQMAQQAPPGLFNIKEVAMRSLKVLGVQDIEGLFLPPPPPGSQPPPPHQIDAQLKQAQMQSKQQTDQQQIQSKIQIQQLQMQDHAADRASQEKIEEGRLQVQAMKDAQEFQAGITPPGSPQQP